jgi:DNA-binding transcriptional ArsR family regulator
MSTPDLALVFAALGDPVRLNLFERLLGGRALSIRALAEGLTLTRQGVTRHLDVLADAGLIARVRIGRETLCRAAPDAVGPALDYLERARAQWDAAAERLRAMVEE